MATPSGRGRSAAARTLWPWRIAVALAAFAPLPCWLRQAMTGHAGPEPGRYLLEHLGKGTLVLLLLTLSLTPLQRLSRWQGFSRIRRQLGLWTFAYALLHLLAYLWFFLGFNAHALLADLSRRPYIMVGMAALAGLTLMAATSHRRAMRRLGKSWKRLHRLVYAVLILGLLHYFWIVRADLGEWAIYALAGLLLLVLRLPPVTKEFSRQGRPPVTDA